MSRLQEMIDVEKDLENRTVNFENYIKESAAAYKIQYDFRRYK